MRATGQVMRWAWMGIGFVLIAIGAVGVFIPFTFHILGGLSVVGLILVLRSSFRWRRRFVRMQRRYPRFIYPVRRLLKRNPAVWPVLWHEMLRSERFFVPHRWRRLRRWRLKIKAWRAAKAKR